MNFENTICATILFSDKMNEEITENNN